MDDGDLKIGTKETLVAFSKTLFCLRRWSLRYVRSVRTTYIRNSHPTSATCLTWQYVSLSYASEYYSSSSHRSRGNRTAVLRLALIDTGPHKHELKMVHQSI